MTAVSRIGTGAKLCKILHCLHNNPSTRKEVSKCTGLAKNSVESFIRFLVANKILEIRGVGESTRGNRPYIYGIAIKETYTP